MTITDPPIMLGFLQRVVDERAPLSIILPGVDMPFDSLLLSVDSSLDALVIDELNPITGHRRIRPNLLLRIGTRLDGVELRFRTRVAAIDRDSDIAAYLLDFPIELDYRERRNTYRVKIPATAPMSWTVPVEGTEDQMATLRVVDLSLGGLGLALRHPHSSKVLDVTSGVLDLPDGPLTVTAKIRYLRKNAFGATEDRAGGEFVGIGAQELRRLSQFSAELQRPLLRGRRIWISKEN